MELHSLSTDEDVLRRQAEELWLPYHRDLEAVVESHALGFEPHRKMLILDVEGL